ncbi:MAG: hypothetical protein DRH32_02395 [Deltaproteobacteria bacterium]|nr:MAG: hypothetical protein DRH32_02395 [Deltaproteobacteria bacterium]
MPLRLSARPDKISFGIDSASVPSYFVRIYRQVLFVNWRTQRLFNKMTGFWAQVKCFDFDCCALNYFQEEVHEFCKV